MRERVETGALLVVLLAACVLIGGCRFGETVYVDEQGHRLAVDAEGRPVVHEEDWSVLESHAPPPARIYTPSPVAPIPTVQPTPVTRPAPVEPPAAAVQPGPGRYTPPAPFPGRATPAVPGTSAALGAPPTGGR